MNYYAGIDNSSLDHTVRIIDEKGILKSSFTIENTLGGFINLHQTLKRFENIKIGFELPHGPLVDFLHDQTYHLYSLNPLKVKRYKESVKVSGNKNDDIDAYAIADYLRNKATDARELLFNSSEVERLKTLSIIHNRLMKEHTRYINKLHFTLKLIEVLSNLLNKYNIYLNKSILST